MAEPFEQSLDYKYRELCFVVGHLFITFAQLETTLGAMLKIHLAGAMGDHLNHEKVSLASAIYGGMRFGTARDAIKRIAVAERVADRTLNRALEAFAHVGHIQDLRDKIAHHTLVPAFEGADAYWQVTDATVTRDIRNPKVYVFDSEALLHAAADLTLAGKRFGGPVKTGHILRTFEENREPFAWRYKPSMLKLVPRSKLRWPPEQPPRQGSSPL